MVRPMQVFAMRRKPLNLRPLLDPGTEAFQLSYFACSDIQQDDAALQVNANDFRRV